MSHTSAARWHSTRAVALVAGLLTAGGLFLHAAFGSPAAPQEPAKDKKEVPAKDKNDTPAKDKKTEEKKPYVYKPVKAITLPSDVSNDVREMTKLINTKLEAGWKENKLQPSQPASDYEFLRRASLDIIGRIAKPDEMAAYFKDPAATRRTRLIDRLLASPDYPRHWANLWANWLLGRSGLFGKGKYHEDLATWLEDQFAQNKPYHEIATALITAKGKNTDLPQVNFILAHLGEPVPAAKRASEGDFEMVPITSRITRLFLGIQTQCTQCHDHPFDANLKQEHFWGINAFLRQVRREGTPPNMNNPRQAMALPPLTLTENDRANPTATITFEKRSGVFLEVKPRFFEIKEVNIKEGSRRETLANLIVQHENFGKSLVNRLWGVFFGKGFVNPIDDFNDQNQPSNPELLAELGKKFRHYGFDQKKLIRWICNSDAYNLSCVANDTNDKPEHEVFFSRMPMKALSPEQLYASLVVATQIEQKKEEAQRQRQTWLDALVQNFGDDEGNEVSFNGTIVQALMMMNGEHINTAITSKEGTVANVMKDRKLRSFDQQVDAIYKIALNRPVTQKERAKIVKEMQDALRKLRAPRPDQVARLQENVLQDVLWALVNSNEFMLNH